MALPPTVLFAAKSRHQENQEAAGYDESTAQDDSVVRKLPEEDKRNHLRHYEEDRDVDSHQAIEIYAALVDQDSVGEENERACRHPVGRAAKSYPHERIAADF